MSCDITAEAPRPRPLSAGIWTLFSWLRRDERSFSHESLSSAGSDRTAVSFAFLEPLNYKAATEPIPLPPLSPPSDSYRKRVRDRNYRRQRERDITLHRKYGLFKGENSDRFEAFSLPAAHRHSSVTVERAERARRATSESFQRRAPYVPGKRRAPLPPTVTTSLPRNFSRKRPAPQPPNNLRKLDNLHLEQMSSKSDRNRHSLLINNVSTENKIDKNIKQDKIKPEKSFLKQIFDNRKRNSAVEPSYIKLLPNISELDKQAAEIIENKKQKVVDADASNSANKKNFVDLEKTWSCSVCFKQNKPATSSCTYCMLGKNESNEMEKNKSNILSGLGSNIYTQTDTNVANAVTASKVCENEEKKKLKEMLKEMKDSLPKRPKSNLFVSNESPTLRIGCTSTFQDKKESLRQGNVLNTFENMKEMTKNENKCTDIRISQVLDNTNINSHTMQPSSSGVSTDNRLKTNLTSLKNTDTNSEASKSNSKDLQINNNIGEKEIAKSKISLTIQSNNQEPKKEINKNVSSEKFLGKEIATSSSLANDSLLNKRNEVKLTDIQQTSPNNILKADSKSLKLEFLNVKNTETLKTTKDNALFLADNELRNKKENNELAKSPVPYNGDIKKEQNHSTSSSNIIINDPAQTNKIPRPIQTHDLKNTNSNISTSSKLNTPLKISSLLNPIYRPIQNSSVPSKTSPDRDNIKSHNINQVLSNQKLKPIKELSEVNDKELEQINQIKPSSSKPSISNEYSTNASVCKVLGVTPSLPNNSENKVQTKIDHHLRRRELVSQLEKSIAKGDEQAAADAAVKLAKLRLSCSVLSFSSQIIGNTGETSKLSDNIIGIKEKTREERIGTSKMGIQNRAGVSLIEHDTGTSNDNVKNKINTQSYLKERDSNALSDKLIGNPTKNSSEQSTSKKDDFINGKISIQVWVEDKEATRGPISLQIPREATLGELRRQAEISLGLDSRLQRWIVGRTLCLDITTRLINLAGPDLRAPFYLCLVETETKKDTPGELANNQVKTKETTPTIDNTGVDNVYNELMKLEQQAIVSNTEEFECEVCMEIYEVGRGAVLRDCIHTFCRDCLADVVRHCEDPIVSCPAMACPGVLQEREIRALLNAEEYERWLARGLATAECGTRNAFHCRTRDCKGWALCEPGVRKFPCPVCKCNNCVSCQAIHEGETCEQYQTKLQTTVTAAQANETDEGTRALLNSLIRRGEALECPECHAIITKKWGCDWVKCSACKTEICWVTRGRRWGPAGRGDTSAGCRCGVDGKRCHPSCGYCH